MLVQSVKDFDRRITRQHGPSTRVVETGLKLDFVAQAAYTQSCAYHADLQLRDYWTSEAYTRQWVVVNASTAPRQLDVDLVGRRVVNTVDDTVKALRHDTTVHTSQTHTAARLMSNIIIMFV